jgi:tRNA-2-methylthio-N6-dimethylallyladenosine synthase
VTYYLWTIGCQMNVADSRRVAEELEQLGFQPASRPEDADLILLNTCVVRQSAEDKVIGRLTSLRGLKRYKPGLHLALMGCFVDDVPALQQRYPWVDAFSCPLTWLPSSSWPGASLPGSPWSRTTLPWLAALFSRAGSRLYRGADQLRLQPRVHLLHRPPAPWPRGEPPCGRDRGRGAALARRGVREVTLLGQNVDSYGRDLAPLIRPGPEGGPPDLADLLEAVHEVEGLARIRFLTSHPADMTDRLLQTAACLPKVCEHMEMPVQSGDDTLLRRMGRGYTVAGYRNLVARARRALPTRRPLPWGWPPTSSSAFPARRRPVRGHLPAAGGTTL